jgi:hydrogenase expression/formation protein HypC
MCLAVPARVIESDGEEAVVDLQGSRLKISRVLTPEANVGDWVLVHAGFAISQIDEDEARQTWEYLKEIDELNAEAIDDAGGESA